jgi:hypothetical protein
MNNTRNAEPAMDSGNADFAGANLPMTFETLFIATNSSGTNLNRGGAGPEGARAWAARVTHQEKRIASRRDAEIAEKFCQVFCFLTLMRCVPRVSARDILMFYFSSWRFR